LPAGRVSLRPVPSKTSAKTNQTLIRPVAVTGDPRHASSDRPDRPSARK
jgi:hypothetical protein